MTKNELLVLLSNEAIPGDARICIKLDEISLASPWTGIVGHEIGVYTLDDPDGEPVVVLIPTFPLVCECETNLKAEYVELCDAVAPVREPAEILTFPHRQLD